MKSRSNDERRGGGGRRRRRPARSGPTEDRKDDASRQRLQDALEIITSGAKAKVSPSTERLLSGPDGERHMNAVQARARKWIWHRSVQALGVAAQKKGGRKTGDLAIVVFVDRKRPRDKVRHPVPRGVRIAGLGWIKIDVWAIGKLEPHMFPDRVRPAMPGCSIGHEDMETYGTFGLVVRKQDDDSALYVLSNSHVLALDGLAKKGDDIVQPGPGDSWGHSNDKIAKLADFVAFDFTPEAFLNTVDAAIARVTKASSVDTMIREIDIAPTNVSFAITEEMLVRKVGRTTDETTGTVQCASTKVKLEYMQTATTSAFIGFDDQVLCDRYASPGDSGSILLNDKDEVIGLHVAGSASACTFNKIEHVFGLLKIKLA